MKNTRDFETKIRNGQARVVSEAFGVADNFCARKEKNKNQFVESIKKTPPKQLLEANLELAELTIEAKYLSIQLNSLKTISLELNRACAKRSGKKK